MKSRSIVALAAVTALSLTGCAMGGTGPAATSAPAVTASAKPTGSITVWSWDVAATALKRLATEYQSSHPDTTIDVVDIGYDNAYDKISVGLQAGSGLPDLVTIETDHASGYLSQFPQGFVKLDSVIGDKKADFDPSKWAAATGTDGGIYMVPWDSGTVALYYRSDYLKAAGVDPNSLTTWDALIAAGERIKATTGHTLMSIDVSSGATFGMLMQQQGAWIFDAQGNVSVNSPQAVQALTVLKTIHDKGLLKNVKGWDGRVSSTKAGDSAVHPEAVWWIGTLESEMKELSGKFGVVPLPAFGDSARTAANGGSNLAVPAQAKNPTLAADFAAWVLADAKNQASMMEKEGLFPAYLPALTEPIFNQPDKYFGGQKVYQLFAEQTAKIPPVNFTGDAAKASDIVGNAVVAAVLNGKDPKTVLDDAAKQIATATGRQIAG
ncbi:MAG: extracellular solute-binding protein [Propionibacteriaceae bacterium]|nr:extracellular solute-binding protein [Propionibacteriaceae bacterium]